MGGWGISCNTHELPKKYFLIFILHKDRFEKIKILQYRTIYVYEKLKWFSWKYIVILNQREFLVEKVFHGNKKIMNRWLIYWFIFIYAKNIMDGWKVKFEVNKLNIYILFIDQIFFFNFTWTCIVLSNELNNNGRTSDRISSRGVFSNITWRFSSRVTVAWIVFGAAKTARNVGRIIISYSSFDASWTRARAGWRTAASTSAVRISCCKHGQTCCHHNF